MLFLGKIKKNSMRVEGSQDGSKTTLHKPVGDVTHALSILYAVSGPDDIWADGTPRKCTSFCKTRQGVVTTLARKALIDI